MLKKLVVFAALVLLSVTACGQLLSPKRIVFEKDTGIFFSTSQEIQLLVKLKQLEQCEIEKNKWILYADNADRQLKRERVAYDSLRLDFTESVSISHDWQKRYTDEYTAHQNTRLLLQQETDKKITWRKTATYAGGAFLILFGANVYFLTH